MTNNRYANSKYTCKVEIKVSGRDRNEKTTNK